MPNSSLSSERIRAQSPEACPIAEFDGFGHHDDRPGCVTLAAAISVEGDFRLGGALFGCLVVSWLTRPSRSGQRQPRVEFVKVYTVDASEPIAGEFT